jgi:hypothetical protein
MDRNKQVELAFLGPHFGNIKMEVADRIRLELPFGWFVALRVPQTSDAMPLQAAMQRRSREMWDSGLEG